MRTIVVTGGGRHVGKTELAQRLGKLLPDSRVVKLGEHARREERNPLFFSLETSYADVTRSVGECGFLILESGKILDDPECHPNLVVYLPHPEADKPGGERRRHRADIVRGEPLDPGAAERIRASLGVDEQTFTEILEAIS
ncbi:MAG: hypothetical protein JRF63_04820 [Deltaproteobacteria bacterium]|nr:hypothetical protein [Deltaproteobacteria bacterium]